MNTPFPSVTAASPVEMCLELVVANTHALRAGSMARHSFGRHGGTIGSRNADWMLDDGHGAVQPIHCQVSWIDGSFCVRDQSGLTRINDATTALRRGTVARLRDGDVLHIGAYHVNVLIQEVREDASDSRPLAQRTVGEILNEADPRLHHTLAGCDAMLDRLARKTDFAPFDALAKVSRPGEECDPLLALEIAQQHSLEQAETDRKQETQ